MGPETNTRFKSELKNLNFLSSLSTKYLLLRIKKGFLEVMLNFADFLFILSIPLVFEV